VTAPCHGCHGTGNEPSGTTYAGLAEQLACDECGPDCAQDCGCRVDSEPRRVCSRPEQRVAGELAEVAFFDLAIEHQLTMLPTGEHRALVPVHWSDQANAIAAPYASAREVWERCQESHGLACATTGRARDFAARVEAENARLREGIESMMRDVGKAQPAHVTPGIVAVRLKALLAEDEGGE
jgi:hypothetical protein